MKPTIGQTYTVIEAGRTTERTPLEVFLHNGILSVQYSKPKGGSQKRTREVRLCTLDQWNVWVRRAS